MMGREFEGQQFDVATVVSSVLYGCKVNHNSEWKMPEWAM